MPYWFRVMLAFGVVATPLFFPAWAMSAPPEPMLVGQDSVPAAPRRAKLALLVGINTYRAQHVPRLRGCENDVRAMEALLVGKFDFRSTDIRVLLNEDATKERIVDALQSLVADAKAAGPASMADRPICVFHFSGHGSQVEDTSGDEIDGRDESLVPYDSVDSAGDIIDDDLQSLLSELAGVSGSVTCIFDSCHSGSAAKGEGQSRLLPRPLPPQTRLVRETEFEDSQAFTLISSCRSDQRAHEVTDEQGMVHGALTYCLTRELWTSREPQPTYRDVMDRVSRRVNGLRPQHPQLSGGTIDTVVFDDQEILAQPFLLVYSQDGLVSLRAGAAHGVSTGTVLDVFRPGTKVFNGSEPPLARIQVTDTDAFTSNVEVIEGGPVPDVARAVIVQQGVSATPVPLFVDANGETHVDAVTNAKLCDAVRAALDASNELRDQYRLVSAAGDAQLKVVVLRDGTIRVMGRQITSPGVPVDDSDAVDRILAQLKHWARWYRLMELRNDAAGLLIDFEMTGPERGTDENGIRQHYAGDRLSISVTNRSARSVYFAILALSDDGAVKLLYPVRGDSEQLTEGGASKTELEAYVEDGDQESFDVLKLLVFAQAVDTSLLISASVPKGSNHDPLSAMDVRDIRFPFAAAVQNTKGASLVEADAWFTDRIEFKVVRPPHGPR